MVKADRILVVDDEQSLRESLEILLGREGYVVRTAADVDHALAELRSFAPDLILTDMKMDQGTGVDLLRDAKAIDPRVEVIVLTAYARAEDAVEAMKLGAYDYLIKPFNVEELRLQVERALEKRRLGVENVRLRERLRTREQVGEIVVASDAMANVIEMVDRVAAVDATVLITGESGVGKEVVARRIHERGPRSEASFVAVNCGALPENLIESELFGYERGAFTGADRAKPGLIETADRGTVFLDEIGELPVSAQVKLLRVLDDCSIRRLGGEKGRPLDARFIAATNRDLENDVRTGEFREDLYYRINVLRIHIPPLRERPEDVEVLVREFSHRAGKRLGIEVEEIDPQLVDLLKEYSFPGNVRELENLVERAVILSGGARLTPDALPADVTGSDRLVQEVARGDIGPGFDLTDYLEGIERRLLRRALRTTDGVKTEAAELLGLTFRQFRYKLKKYGID